MKRAVIRLVAILIVFILLRELLRLLPNEISTSLVPGYHMSIAWDEWALSIVASIILMLTALVSWVYGIAYSVVEKVISSRSKKH